MSSIARRARRMPPKVKARMLREMQSYPSRACICGRTHNTGLAMCPSCTPRFDRARFRL
jgi:hypothetical protein